LNYICDALQITCNISYVDETGKNHSHKQYGVEIKLSRPKINLILMLLVIVLLSSQLYYRKDY
jgi:hypothetical protein